jgi:hypothetical protein
MAAHYDQQKSLKYVLMRFSNGQRCPILLIADRPDRPTGGSHMPLTRVSLRQGKPAAYRQAILEGLSQTLAQAAG